MWEEEKTLTEFQLRKELLVVILQSSKLISKYSVMSLWILSLEHCSASETECEGSNLAFSYSTVTSANSI